MRFSQTLPHAARVPAACALLCLGALILQGCGPSEDAPKPSESDRLYAELDARFPEGRPGITGVAQRMQDKEYLASLKTSIGEGQVLADDLARAQQELSRFRKAYAEDRKTPEGALPDDKALDAALANHAHYQKLVAAVEAAQAKVTEHQTAARATIRERMSREQKEYDTLKAQADAVAKSEGQPVRVGRDSVPAPQPKVTRSVTAPVATPTSPTPTAKDLAEQLNKPLVETAK